MATEALDPAHFDPTDDVMEEHAYEIYEALRDHAPVFETDSYGRAKWLLSEDRVWVFTSFDAVRDAVLDHETFSSQRSDRVAPRKDPLPLIPIDKDPPEHRYYREVIREPFMAKTVAGLEDSVRKTCSTLLDSIADIDRPDLVKTYCERLPALVLWQEPLLGSPLEMSGADWVATLSQWIHEIKDPARSEQGTEALLQYCRAILEARRRTPGRDIPSRLVEEIREGKLSNDEAAYFLWFLTKAGIETPAAALGSFVWLLGTNDKVKDAVLQDPAVLNDTVEEFLRFVGPVQTGRRTVAKDTMWHGEQLRRGDTVMLLWGSANRDEAMFESAASFVAERTGVGPNRHLAFGAGIHRCVGSHLARLQIRIALQELISRYPEFRIVADVDWNVGGVERSPESLIALMQE